MLRILVDLITLRAEGDPMPTPQHMRGLSDESFRDLTGLEKVPPPDPRLDVPPGYRWRPTPEMWLDRPDHVGKGLWPCTINREPLAKNQKHSEEADVVVDAEAKTVTITLKAVDMTSVEIGAGGSGGA